MVRAQLQSPALDRHPQPRSAPALARRPRRGITPCAYIGSPHNHYKVRVADCDHAPAVEAIHAKDRPVIDALHPSLAAAPDGILPPRAHLLVSGLPEYMQAIIGQSVFQEILRDAEGDEKFRRRLCDPKLPPLEAPFALSKELPAVDRSLFFTRRLMIDLLCTGTNSFLSTTLDDTPFCSQEM